MEILNAIAAVLATMGIEYIVMEVGGVVLLFFVFFGVRKLIKLQKTILDKISNHHGTTIEKIQNNHREIDPQHLYAKFNRIEDNLDNYEEKLSIHQHEEVRQLHDVHNKVVQIDTKLDSFRTNCSNRRGNSFSDE